MVEISNFGLQKSFIPQKAAGNLYKTDSARKSKILYKKIYFFQFFQFFRDMLEDPKKFSKFNFQKNSEGNSKNSLLGINQIPYPRK